MDTLRKFITTNPLLCFLLLIVVMASAGGIYAGLTLNTLQTQNAELRSILVSAASRDSTARQVGATLVP